MPQLTRQFSSPRRRSLTRRLGLEQLESRTLLATSELPQFDEMLLDGLESSSEEISHMVAGSSDQATGAAPVETAWGGDTMYVLSDRTDQLYRVDGGLIPIATLGRDVESLTWDPDKERLIAIGDEILYEVDPEPLVLN